jgi:hypothetical protein
LLALANVSDQSVSLDASRLRDEMATRHVEEIISGERKAPDASVSLQPYEIAWLKASSR